MARKSLMRPDVAVRDVFPVDEPLAVPVVKFLGRFEELKIIPKRLVALEGKPSENVAEQLMLVRMASIAICEIAEVVKEELAANEEFMRALEQVPDDRRLFDDGRRRLAESAKAWQHVRDHVGAHFNSVAIKNALANVADGRGAMEFVDSGVDFRFDPVHLVLAAAMHGMKRVEALDLAPTLDRLAEAHVAASMIVSPVLSAYELVTNALLGEHRRRR
jgi:hypothetical protein